MTKQQMDATAIGVELDQLNDGAEERWQLAGDRLQRTFVFANFVEAFGFMTRAAIHAEKMNHHPEWSNVYKTVEVELTTHEAGGITELDFELAKKMNRLARRQDGDG